VISHRDLVVVFVAEKFRQGGQTGIASSLDEKLLARFLRELPDVDHKGGRVIPFEARKIVLESLGRIVASKQEATNFVRAKLKPRVHQFVTMIETQRFDSSLTWPMHEAGLFLSMIALQVAIDSEAATMSARIGLATDYIHWLGRLVRSDVAASYYVDLEQVPPEILSDLLLVAKQVAKAREVLGEALDEPIVRLKRDDWVPRLFKDMLATS
jgi:hypothetical protein